MRNSLHFDTFKKCLLRDFGKKGGTPDCTLKSSVRNKQNRLKQIMAVVEICML